MNQPEEPLDAGRRWLINWFLVRAVNLVVVDAQRVDKLMSGAHASRAIN